MFYGSHTPLARPSVKQIENATSHKPSRGVKLTFNPPIAMGVLILHMARLAKWTSESCQITKYSYIFKIMLLGQCLDVQMTTEVPEMCRILKCNKTTRRNIIELKILPIFTHLCVIPNPYAFFFFISWKTKDDIGPKCCVERFFTIFGPTRWKANNETIFIFKWIIPLHLVIKHIWCKTPEA